MCEGFTATLSSLLRFADIWAFRSHVSTLTTTLQEPQSYADLDVSRGADFIVATDGNFSQRHRKDAGDCPEFYSPEYFLTKEYVDNVGKRIAAARGRPPKARKPAKVPDEAVDECEDGHDSGSGSTVKTNMDHYDDGGVMALVCRHDAPLFLANIDTPG